MRVLIVNGPNLNLLGHREPEIYGHQTFEDILADLRDRFSSHELGYFQSNHEGELIDRLQAAGQEGWDGLVVNLGAFTHYSYALYDTLRALKLPKVEVHLSHIFAREPFRHVSVISPACDGMISGLGAEGYRLALEWLMGRPKKN